MCVMSMVHDHYRDQFPANPIWPPQYTPWTFPPSNPQIPSQALDLPALRKLIDEFNAAVAAAKTLDALMKQPDCVDPEKSKLQDRVAALEKIVAELTAQGRK